MFSTYAQSQEVELGISGGGYLNNVDKTNQVAGFGLGVDFAYNFSKHSAVRLKAMTASNDYFENEYVALTGVQNTRPDLRNTTNNDLQVSLLYERNFIVSESFKMNTNLGIGIISTQNNAFMWIHNLENGTTISVGDDASYLGGFPFSLGGEYSLKSWNLGLEGGAMIDTQEGLVGIFYGPKISKRFRNNCS